eukprot:g33420.t1
MADSHDMEDFFCAVKTTFRSNTQGPTLLLVKDGMTLIKDEEVSSDAGWSTSETSSSRALPAGEMQRKEPTLYMAIFNLTKAFDAVNQEVLWSILLCFDCTMKFAIILRLLYDDMEVMVTTNGSTTDSFPIQSGVIAPTLFSICLTAMLHLTVDKLPAGVDVIELQYMDDACVCTVSEDVLHTMISTFMEAYEHLGLTLNI